MIKQPNVRFMTQSALIAALYVVLTFLSHMAGLDAGVIQLRLSEMLTVLPLFTPAAIPGLLVGCLLANMLTGALLWDVLLGSLATLIGALGTYRWRGHPFLSLLPPILANTVIVSCVLCFAYHAEASLWYVMLTVGAGESLSCGVLGYTLGRVLKKAGHAIPWA